MEKGKKLTETHYEMFKRRPLDTLDELDTAYRDLIHFLQHHEYYDTIDRIEKGEALYEAEIDPNKRKRYKARLDELYAKLAELEAKGAAA
jgi:hypothetical protein